jgi:hypothetical protein
MFRLDAFKLTDMASCTADIRQFGLESDSFEEAAEQIIQYFYSNFCDDKGAPALSLARVFKTVRFSALDDELKRYAQQEFDSIADTRFLALMASVGAMSTWNDRRQSLRHRLVPVSDKRELRTKLPMIAALMNEYDTSSDRDQDDQHSTGSYILEPDQKRFNVFYVPEASTCNLITEQEFVREHYIRSVLGFGGMLNSSSSFWIVMFCRVFVPKEIAQMFNPLCLSAKNALLHSADFRPIVARRELA